MRTISLTDPIVLKGGAGLALYAFGGSELCKLAGLALAGWAAWEYFGPSSASSAPAPALAPMPQQQPGGPDAAGRLPGELFYGWPLHYTPSVRPLRPGEGPDSHTHTHAQEDAGGKVIPLRGGTDG